MAKIICNNHDKLLFAFLYPFGALIYVLKNWRKSWAMNVFWVVCIFMGSIQIFHPKGTVLGDGSDAGRYILGLQYMYQNAKTFSDVSQYFYEDSTIDVFGPTLQFFVSRFTDNGHVFFFVLAIIFGFFYSRNMWYVLNRLPKRLGRGVWVIIALMFLVCPIWLINGVRMWTACQVFTYGALPFLIEKKYKRLWWCVIAILIHHSFIFPISLILIYAFIPERIRLSQKVLLGLMAFFMFSLTVKSLNLSLVNNTLQNFLPSYYENRVEGYVNENTLDREVEALSANSWHVGFFDNIQFGVIILFVVFTYFTIRRNYRHKDVKWITHLFVFSLLIFSAANIMANVPSGGRFLTVAKMFMIPAILLTLTYLPIGMKYRTYMQPMLFVLAFSLIFDIRKGFDYYSYMLIIGNFIASLFVEENVPLIMLLK